jgi:catechol 2,3-dioxygenase-like lactoylglutathione lyase family enzyme
MAPKTTGIIETVLYVANVVQSAEWYSRLLGFPVIFGEKDRLRALDAGGGRVLLLFREGASTDATQVQGGTIPSHDGSGPVHVAFGMQTSDAEAWEQRLTASGIEVEARVDWSAESKSLYFRDPDHHLVELITAEHWISVAAAADSQSRQP